MKDKEAFSLAIDDLKFSKHRKTKAFYFGRDKDVVKKAKSGQLALTASRKLGEIRNKEGEKRSGCLRRFFLTICCYFLLHYVQQHRHLLQQHQQQQVGVQRLLLQLRRAQKRVTRNKEIIK